MCGRYTLHQKAENIAKRFHVSAEPNSVPESYNVAPGQIMPVITEDDQGRHLEHMRWGLIPVWAKDPKIGYRLINARDDGVFEKPMWRKLIRQKRAIIPADGFYEWKKMGGTSLTAKPHKQPYFIRPKQIEIFGFAGLWEQWQDADGHQIKTYSIITTEPNKEMANIHTRMPVILRQADEQTWLSPAINDDVEKIGAFLHPYSDNGLELYPISPAVNVVQNNDASLIYPMKSQ